MLKKNITRLAIAICFVLPALLVCSDASRQDSAEVSTDLSVLTFALPDLNGNGKTAALFTKDITIVDFWTTWCPPCRESIPHLNAFYAGNRDRVDMIGISLDTAPPADVAAFAKAMNIEYPVLTGGRDLAVTYGISSIPTIFVVDAGGKILKRHVGMSDSRTLEALLKGL